MRTARYLRAAGLRGGDWSAAGTGSRGVAIGALTMASDMMTSSSSAAPEEGPASLLIG